MYIENNLILKRIIQYIYEEIIKHGENHFQDFLDAANLLLPYYQDQTPLGRLEKYLKQFQGKEYYLINDGYSNYRYIRSDPSFYFKKYCERVNGDRINRYADNIHKISQDVYFQEVLAEDISYGYSRIFINGTEKTSYFRCMHCGSALMKLGGELAIDIKILSEVNNKFVTHNCEKDKVLWDNPFTQVMHGFLHPLIVNQNDDIFRERLETINNFLFLENKICTIKSTPKGRKITLENLSVDTEEISSYFMLLDSDSKAIMFFNESLVASVKSKLNEAIVAYKHKCYRSSIMLLLDIIKILVRECIVHLNSEMENSKHPVELEKFSLTDVINHFNFLMEKKLLSEKTLSILKQLQNNNFIIFQTNIEKADKLQNEFIFQLLNSLLSDIKGNLDKKVTI